MPSHALDEQAVPRPNGRVAGGSEQACRGGFPPFVRAAWIYDEQSLPTWLYQRPVRDAITGVFISRSLIGVYGDHEGSFYPRWTGLARSRQASDDCTAPV